MRSLLFFFSPKHMSPLCLILVPLSAMLLLSLTQPLSPLASFFLESLGIKSHTSG